MNSAGLSRQHIVCGELFGPPPWMQEMFDIVMSWGVIEHFEDTAGCLQACSRFLKPGGTMITVIPNMCGIPGLL